MKKRKLMTILLGSGICASLIGVGITFSNNAQYGSADTVEIITETIQDSCFIGEKLEVPEQVEIKINENVVNSGNGILIAPSGIVYEEVSQELNEEGTYQLVYQVSQDGKTFTAVKEIDVNDYNWKFSSVGTTANFGELNLSDSEEQGLTFSLADGESFIYQTPINIYDESHNGEIDVCNIYPNIRTLNTVTGEASDVAKFVMVRLVDCYDETNYVEFCTTSGYYASAGASNQIKTGLEGVAPSATYGNLVLNGNKYILHQLLAFNIAQTQYGTYVGPDEDMSSANFASIGGINFSWNVKTNEVFSTKVINGNIRKQLVTDLDEPIIQGDNIFKGFTTGEVYLEISCVAYTSSLTANLQVVSLLGKSGEDLKSQEYVDTVAPIVQLDFEKTDESGIYVAVGEKVQIPPVVVLDQHYFGALDTRVYYNYGSKSQSLVCVKDGEFTPTKLGNYTVVYKAKDAYGNVGELELTLNCIKEESFRYTMQELSTLIAGQKHQLPEITVVGINREVVTEMTVMDPNGEVLSVEDCAFEPKQLGTYLIRYTFKDNVYTSFYEYEVECVDPQNSIKFYDSITLPKYFIKGAKYAIEDYYAYTFGTDGLVPHLTEASVSVDGGAFRDLTAEEKKSFTVSANSTIQFAYSYKDQQVKSSVLSVIDVGYTQTKDYTKYFVGNHKTETTNKNIVFTVDGSRKTERIDFINPISLTNFYLALEFVEECDNFDALVITLEDYKNASNRIQITMGNSVKKNLVYTINGVSYELETAFVASHRLWFEPATREIQTNRNMADVVLPFETDLCCLSFEMVGIKGQSSVAISKINNQSFRTKTSEAVPMLTYQKLDGVFNVDDTVEIGEGRFSSLLNPVLTNDITVTVKDDEGNVIKSVDGVLLDRVVATQTYIVKLETLGTYWITYEAKCFTGTNYVENSGVYAINVVDDTAPVVTFDNGIEGAFIKVKQGRTYETAKFTVSDNYTETGSLFTTIEIYNYNYSLVAHKIVKEYPTTLTYTFTEKGTYSVRVVCMDEEWNITIASYNIVVE